MFLPRAIDKARASLPGGKLGDYFVTRTDMRTLSALFFRRLGLKEADFTAWVAAARSEEDVALRVRAAVEQATIEAWNAQLPGIRVRDIDPATREFIEKTYEAARTWKMDEALIDAIERDDRHSFAPRG